MNPKPKKISDVMPKEYSDFVAFCSSSGKYFTNQLTNVDYIAFRYSCHKTKEYISEIKSYINSNRNLIKYESNNKREEIISREIHDGNSNYLADSKEIEVVSNNMDLTLADIFGVNADSFKNISIKQLCLSVRAKNCLLKKNWITVNDILLKTKSDIKELRSIGTKTLDEIVEKTREFVAKPKCYDTYGFNAFEPKDAESTLADILGVNAEAYANVSTRRLNFSIRVINCLRRNKCLTIKDILSRKKSDIIRFRNLGKKTFDEILQKTKAFVTKPENPKTRGLNVVEPKDVELTLADIFDVNADSFKNISIDQLKLSVRAKNCLVDNNCTTIDAILLKTESDIKNIRNLGTVTFYDIIEKTRVFVVKSVKLKKPMPREKTDVLTNDENLTNVIKNILNRKNFTMTKLTATQEGLASKVVNSMELIDKISNSMPDKLVQPFICAYSTQVGKSLQELYLECDNTTVFSDIPTIYKKILGKKFKAEIIDEINSFLNWAYFDINEIAETIFNNIKNAITVNNSRALDIIKLRSKGKTLEEIGSRYGLTRERIRQIITKTVKLFWSTYDEQMHDLIMLVYALKNGDTVLRFDKIKEVIGTHFTTILWLCIKQKPEHNSYYYLKAFDAIVVKMGNEKKLNERKISLSIDKFIESLPSVLKTVEKNSLINEFAKSKSIPVEFIKEAFKERFEKTGNFYYKGRLTVSFMCEYVLKHRFPAGFKIADEFEAERFRQYMKEFFGEGISVITSRALDAKIGTIGILCERGKYIHPDFLQVDKKIISTVNDYIKNSTKNVLLYGDIFNALKDVLIGTQITNKYILQGALKKYGCKYNTGRDFVSKISSVTIVDELERFIEERGIVHKMEIFFVFLSISDAGLPQIVARSTNVFSIENGYYIHVSQFDIQPEDYQPLREFLIQEIQDIPVNIRSIYDNLSTKYPDFMLRNNVDNKGKLFAVLYYMFRNEFSFSRSYIAKLGTKEITNRNVILKHIEDYDTIEIEDLIDICVKNGIHIVSYPYLFQQLLPEYVRINKRILMKRSLTGITESVVEDAVKIVLEMLQSNDFIHVAQITDYLWFPQINVEWNSFLLENIIASNNKINAIYTSGNIIDRPITIYVSDTYKDDNFTSFVIKVLTKEVRSGNFMTKYEMRDWLRDKDLITGGLPSFLVGEKYFYSDATGVHCSTEQEDV